MPRYQAVSLPAFISGRVPMNSRRIDKDKSLAALYPEIAAQWHPAMNGDLTPYDVGNGSNVKVWWMCDKGHKWQAMPCHRTKHRSGCPYCSGRYAIKGENDLETLYPDLVKEWNYERNGDLQPYDCKPFSNRKVWWICKEGHEWQTEVYHRTGRGTGCPYCSGNIVIPGKTDLQTLFPEIACEFDADKNKETTPSQVCAKSGKKIWWLCNKGHSWQASVISRTNLKAGCPFCVGKHPVPGVNDLATLRPDLAAEWHTEKNRNFTPTDCTISSGRKIWWRCREGHEWQSVVSARTGKDNCGCPYCCGRYAISGINDLEIVNPELASEWHPTKNKAKPSHILPNSNKKAWWLCPECGYEWRTLITSRSARGSGCPRCAGRVR